MRRNIYNKRGFAGGLLCLLLAVGCCVVMAFQGFQLRLLVSLVLLLALGGADMAWAMSRASRPPRGDERDRCVNEKSAWQTLLILVNGCFLAALALLLAYGLVRDLRLLTASLTLCAVVLAAFVILLGVNLYYEKHM